MDLDNVRRTAERGLALATQEEKDVYQEEFVDLFQHILDEIEQAEIAERESKQRFPTGTKVMSIHGKPAVFK